MAAERSQAEHWQRSEAAELLSVPGPHSHKYSRGVLGLRTGSSRYPGAAVLGAEASWRTGIGLVCYFAPVDDTPPAFGLLSPAAAILAQRPETVFSFDNDEDRARCDAWLLGSGTTPETRSGAERKALLELLAGTAPVVLDAGALGLLPAAHASSRLTAPVIITPHLGEFRRLWESAGLGGAARDEMPRPEVAAGILAEHFGITVLLKGSHSTAASPTGLLLTHGPATPWLATAGTGDVLAGVLGALVASSAKQIRHHPELLARLGVTAVMLHDTAARIASGDTDARGDGKPITALDVAECLPQAVQQIREQRPRVQ